MAHTTWPVPTDVQRLLQSVGIPLASLRSLDLGFTHIQETIDATVAHLQRETVRNFLPAGSDTTRYYDGRGEPEIEVEEMTALTSATVVDVTGAAIYTFPNAKLVFEQQKPMTRLLASAYSLAESTWAEADFQIESTQGLGIWNGQGWVFPSGRQNIGVTGRFNYAATIPDDVWLAVSREAAYGLASEFCFLPTGRVQQHENNGLTTTFKLDTVAITGWHDYFTRTITLYRLQKGRRFRNLTARMI